MGMSGSLLKERVRSRGAGNIKARQAQDALFEIDESFRMIADYTPVAVMLFQNKRLIYANRAAETITCYSGDELLGMNFCSIVHPDFKVFARDQDRRGRRRKARTDRCELKIITKEGTEKWVDATTASTMLLDLPTVVISLADITERKHAEKTRLVNETKYRALFENANDAIFLVRDNKFADCNKKTLSMFGCTMERIIGQTPYGLSPPFQPDGADSKEKVLEKMRAAFNGDSQFFEWRHCRYDGSTFDTEVSLNRVVLNDETLIQAIVRDVTERRQYEEKLEGLVCELQEALAKVKVLSGFIPICASCKKIRDDRGYWEQIEVYITEHSDALFSHGICPECARKLYPDHYKEK